MVLYTDWLLALPSLILSVNLTRASNEKKKIKESNLRFSLLKLVYNTLWYVYEFI